MPNARQTSLIASPSSSRATNRRRSSITEHSFHGIHASPGKGEGVTHVSGTICHLCLGPLKLRTRLSVAHPIDETPVFPPAAPSSGWIITPKGPTSVARISTGYSLDVGREDRRKLPFN